MQPKPVTNSPPYSTGYSPDSKKQETQRKKKTLSEQEFCPNCGWPGACKSPLMCMTHVHENSRAEHGLDPTTPEHGVHAEGANYIFTVAADLQARGEATGDE
jgi:hypothetical protein